jgi:hypothetical protein
MALAEGEESGQIQAGLSIQGWLQEHFPTAS